MQFIDNSWSKNAAILLFGATSLGVASFGGFHTAIAQQRATSFANSLEVIGKLLFTAAMLELLTDQSFIFPVASAVVVSGTLSSLSII